MPYHQRAGYRIYYTLEGKSNTPVLMLSHSLGANLEMWEPQIQHLAPKFRILRYDHPGHGKSDLRQGPFTIADLGNDAIALLDELKLSNINFCGLSVGGMVGLWLAVHAPKRFNRMIIASAGARIEDPTLLRRRIATVRREGLMAIEGSVMGGWFTTAYRESSPAKIAWAKAMLHSAKAEGYASMAEAVCAMDLRDELGKIQLPTLIVYGDQDNATPPKWNLAIHAGITNSIACSLPAAHLVNVEAGDSFAERVLQFLSYNDSDETP